MNRIILGALGVLLIFGVGMFWLQGRAEVEAAALPPPVPQSAESRTDDLPQVALTLR